MCGRTLHTAHRRPDASRPRRASTTSSGVSPESPSYSRSRSRCASEFSPAFHLRSLHDHASARLDLRVRVQRAERRPEVPLHRGMFPVVGTLEFTREPHDVESSGQLCGALEYGRPGLEVQDVPVTRGVSVSKQTWPCIRDSPRSSSHMHFDASLSVPLVCRGSEVWRRTLSSA